MSIGLLLDREIQMYENALACLQDGLEHTMISKSPHSIHCYVSDMIQAKSRMEALHGFRTLLRSRGHV